MINPTAALFSIPLLNYMNLTSELFMTNDLSETSKNLINLRFLCDENNFTNNESFDNYNSNSEYITNNFNSSYINCIQSLKFRDSQQLQMNDDFANNNLTATKLMLENISSFVSASDGSSSLSFPLNKTIATITTTMLTTEDVVPDYKWPFLLLSLLVFIGGFGNILVCLAIGFERRLQNATNYFLLRYSYLDFITSNLIQYHH